MPPATGCPATGLAYPEVTRAICLVPSASFSQAPWYALPVHLCRFRVRSHTLELFPGTTRPHGQSDKPAQRFTFVTSSRPRTINPVPIDYGFRPRLRGRLTLRGLTLRRNPWTFGDRVSHSVCRYSCQHSHFRYLHRPSRVRLHRLTERSATKQLSVVSRQLSDRCVRRRPCSIRAISAKFACHARGLLAGATSRGLRRSSTTAAPRRPIPSPSPDSAGTPASEPGCRPATLHQEGADRLRGAPQLIGDPAILLHLRPAQARPMQLKRQPIGTLKHLQRPHIPRHRSLSSCLTTDH